LGQKKIFVKKIVNTSLRLFTKKNQEMESLDKLDSCLKKLLFTLNQLALTLSDAKTVGTSQNPNVIPSYL
jgi:hypothetical protein